MFQNAVKRIAVGLLLGMLLTVAAVAHADPVTVTLASQVQTGLPGQTLSFAGTITNISAGDVYLAGDSATGPGQLTIADSPFIEDFVLATYTSTNSYPLLSHGASLTVPLFTVLIDGSALPGEAYAGSFAIVGGTEQDSQDQLGSVDFNVLVTSGTTTIPEPGSLALLAAGMVAMGGRIWRLHKREVQADANVAWGTQTGVAE